MNRSIFGVAAFAAIAVACGSYPVHAQAPAPVAHKHQSPFMQALGLTKSQMDQVKAIRANSRVQEDTIKLNQSLTPDQKKAQFRVLMRQTNAKIMAILTPDQLAKWKAMRAQQHHAHPGAAATGQPAANPS